MMRPILLTVTMMAEIAASTSTRINVLIALVIVSPTIFTILISVMGSILVFFTLQIGIDFMINIKSTTL